MEENTPSSCIQLLSIYTLYNVTEICSYPFPFPVSLLLCSGSSPTLRMVHLLVCPWGGDWLSDCTAMHLEVQPCWGQCHDVSLQSVGADAWLCRHFFHSDTYYLLCEISCASCFLLCREFNWCFYLLEEDSQLWGPVLSPAFQLLRTPRMFPIVFPGVSTGGGLLRPLNPIKLSSP